MRLTNQHRTIIEEAVREDKFKKPRLEMEKREHKLAMAVLRSCFTESEWRRYRRLPRTWFHIKHNVQVHGPGVSYIYLTLPRVDGHAQSVPACFQHSIPVKGQLAKQVEQWNRDKVKMEEGERETILILRSVLKSVTTVKRLREEWPEGKKYINKLPAESKQLVVQTGALNEALGLT